jgi:threonine/homoserine/homoserine lactone efflux protein
MPDSRHLAAFFVAALLLAITPGPGIFYVLARSLAGGRREGTLSSLGTFCGGLFHVLAAALGLSAVLATSAIAFSVVKYAGAAYLIFLGIQMIRTRNTEPAALAGPDQRLAAIRRHPVLQGIWTEVLNPKTALFFLSFIPQFVVHARGHLFAQFVFLGATSVVLNTLADLAVVQFAGPLGRLFQKNAKFRSRQRAATGLGMIGLGLYVAASDSHS